MITSARTGEVALTVAVRGAWCTSAISPKKSPAFSDAVTLRLFFTTSAVPVDEDEELSPEPAPAESALSLP